MSTLSSVVIKIMAKVKAVISNDLNISALREKYGATAGTVVRVEIYEDRAMTRKIYSAQYRVTDKGIEDVPDDVEPNAVSQTDYETILNLIRGERDIIYQSKRYKQKYDYIRAFAEGRVRVTKVRDREGYLADMSLFEELYETVLPKLRDSIGKHI
jgi:hypothetical protein